MWNWDLSPPHHILPITQTILLRSLTLEPSNLRERCLLWELVDLWELICIWRLFWETVSTVGGGVIVWEGVCLGGTVMFVLDIYCSGSDFVGNLSALTVIQFDIDFIQGSTLKFSIWINLPIKWARNRILNGQLRGKILVHKTKRWFLPMCTGWNILILNLRENEQSFTLSNALRGFRHNWFALTHWESHQLTIGYSLIQRFLKFVKCILTLFLFGVP